MSQAEDIAKKMQDAHDLLTRIHGDKYPEKAKFFQDLMRCESSGVPIMQRLIKMLAGLHRNANYDSTVIWLLAATVDVINEQEPTP